MKKIILLLILSILFGCSSIDTKNQDRKISKYFTLKEAIGISDTAEKYHLDNTPSRKEYENILYTAQRMDEVREALNTPIYITSWYRKKEVNKKGGGSGNSAHLYGLAADFRISGSGRVVKERLDKAGVSYDQLYYYPKYNRLHIGFKPEISQEKRKYIIQ